jgi:hypothetical protein
MLKLLDASSNTWGYVQDEQVLVKASFWYYPNAQKNSDYYQVGIIGNFSCEEHVALDVSKLLFDKIREEFQAKGVKKIVGPMNGNTWQSYRLTTYYGDENTFPLEPFTPKHYIEHWIHAGFMPEHVYSSYVEDISSFSDERSEKLKAKFSELQFKTLSKEDLGPVFDLSLSSFVKNPYYMDIDKSIYMYKYGELLNQLVPNLSVSVYDDKTLVGYLFVMLDAEKRLILKTIAVNTERKYAGLGIYLMIQCFEKAQSLGVKKAIHALSYDGNPVRNIIRQKAEVMRQYTLYKLDV